MKDCSDSFDEIMAIENQLTWADLACAGNSVATGCPGNGFCEASSSPDSCYFSDRSRAASGDDIDIDFRRHFPLEDAMTGLVDIENQGNIDKRNFTDFSTSSEIFDSPLADLFLDPSKIDFEPEAHQWSYLEPVPTLMKNEEEAEVLLHQPVQPHPEEAETLRPCLPQWPTQAQHHVIVQVPQIQWTTAEQSFFVVDDANSSGHAFSGTPIPIQIEKRDEVLPDTSLTSVAVPASEPPKRTGRRTRENTEERFCHVCGERAGRHSYYGGQVCPSCRAFFRRSVQSKYSDSYKCSKNGNCDIRLKTRKNCQYCRFKLCEKAGMRRSWVLADGERKRPLSSKVSTEIPESSGEYLKLDLSESEQISCCVEKMRNCIEKVTEANSKASDKIITLIRDQRKIPPKSLADLVKILEHRAKSFANCVEEFSTLSKHDQKTLLEENQSALFVLGIIHFWKSEISSNSEGVNDTNEKLSVSSSNVLKEIFCGRSQKCRSNASTSINDEKRIKMISQLSNWIDDDSIFCLLNLTILFSNDQCVLDDKLHCEVRQVHFSNLLFRYLLSRSNRASALRKFSEGIHLISICRELTT